MFGSVEKKIFPGKIKIFSRKNNKLFPALPLILCQIKKFKRRVESRKPEAPASSRGMNLPSSYVVFLKLEFSKPPRKKFPDFGSGESLVCGEKKFCRERSSDCIEVGVPNGSRTKLLLSY